MSGSGTALIAEGLALAARADILRQRQSLPVHNRPALRAWHAALADRVNAPAKIAWLGDSITEGAAAAAYGRRWVDRALAALRAAHPTTGLPDGGKGGGFNYLPAVAGGGMTQGQPYAALTGGAVSNVGSFGLGERCAVLDAVGDGMTYTVTCSSFDLHWIRGSGLGTLSVVIDGGAATTFSTAGALSPQVWNSGALTPGAHSVTITRSAGGQVYVAGLTLYLGDETSGIHGYESGRFGWTSTNLATAQSFMWTALGAVGPSLVTVAVGTNDYQAQTPIATFRANLLAIVASIRGVAANTSIALIMYARRGDMAAQPIGWASYVDAVYATADASGAAVIDLSQRLPDAATTGTVDPLGLLADDRLHYSDRGHALIGEMVAGALRL